MRLIFQCYLVGVLCFSVYSHAANDIVNYREYTPTLSSSGQPDASQLQSLAADGFQRVVYLAFTDQDSSFSGEDRIVRDAGMQFIQLPVNWMAPTQQDFDIFSAVMRQDKNLKTLVHCQINWRASSFVFLYRVIELSVPIDDAVVDLYKVWQPQTYWRDFIVKVLRANNIDPDCALCDWSATEAG